MDIKIVLNVEAVVKDVDFFPSKEETEEMFKELFVNGGFEDISLNLEEYKSMN